MIQFAHAGCERVARAAAHRAARTGGHIAAPDRREVVDPADPVAGVPSSALIPAPTIIPASTLVPDRPYVVELDRLGDEIAELAAHLCAATYRLLVLIRQFDEKGGWGNGFRSCAHWLNWRIGVGLGAAREKVRVARALEPLPLLSGAMERGELSYSKVRALTRVATPENEQRLLDFANHGTASHVERLVRAWRRVDRNEELEKEGARHESRSLTLWLDDDGSWELRGRLDPEVGAVLNRALEAADAALYGADKWTTGTPVTQRRADALGLIAECALRGGLGADGADATDGPAGADDSRPAARPPAPGHRADRYQVVVHVDAETLVAGSESGQSVLEDGARSVRIPAETSRRLACDASRVVMTHDTEGRVLDVGRRTRTVPPALRRALEHRDGGCRFPGCGLRYCDAHHVKHWADGGQTKLEHVVLLCRTHHRAVHEEGFRVEIVEGGSGGTGRSGPAVRFYRPDGRALPEVPDPPRLLPDPLAALEAENLRHGVQVDPDTTTPGWLGEGLNLGYAIDVLRL